MTIARYPLHWPDGQPRTRFRKEAAFTVDFTRSRDELLRELSLLRVRNIVLSSNVALRQDGIPYAGTPEPKDPGVAVYFDRQLDGSLKPFVIACDTYSKVRWNLRAIGATVEALRSIQRHGASSMLEQAFTGFAALPPKGSSTRPWWEVLGVWDGADRNVIRKRYRELATEHHPDRGGNAARMAEINVAYQQSGAAL